MDNVSVTPGFSDHDIVLIQVNVKPEVLKQVPRNIYLYKKADWDQLKQSISGVYVKLKQSDLATTTVQSMWDRFATGLEQGIDKFIPIRKAGTRDGFPWINQEIRRLMRKRDKLYKRWSRSGRPYDQSRFIVYKHLVRRVSDRAYEQYLGDIMGLNNDQEDQNGGELPKVKTKKFYSLLKHSKQDSSGIALLRKDGRTLLTETAKANALNDQFQSMFSPKTPISLKSLARSHYKICTTLVPAHHSSPVPTPKCLI